MTIVAPPYPNWLEKVRVDQGVEHACGIVEIYAGVEPEKYRDKYRDEEFDIEPVRICLGVSIDTLSAILCQVVGNTGRPMTANIGLVGNRLPEGDFVRLNSLDVSERKLYAVSRFEIGSATALPPPTEFHDQTLPASVDY